MIKNLDKKYKIQITISGNTLTYNECIIINDSDTIWMEFSDKFGTIFKVNKSFVGIMEELKK